MKISELRELKHSRDRAAAMQLIMGTGYVTPDLLYEIGITNVPRMARDMAEALDYVRAGESVVMYLRAHRCGECGAYAVIDGECQSCNVFTSGGEPCKSAAVRHLTRLEHAKRRDMRCGSVDEWILELDIWEKKK